VLLTGVLLTGVWLTEPEPGIASGRRWSASTSW